MATRKQKEKLIEALKFVPGTYTFRCSGYGGEIVLGTVEREVYEYFKNNDLNISEYAASWSEDEGSVPEEFRPFQPGEWHNCDDICHEYGIEMCDYSTLVVEDQNGNEVWQHNLEPFMLEETGVDVECVEEYYAFSQDENLCVFLGQSIEKGVLFEGTLDLTAPFDPTKLKIVYNDVEGWPVMHGISYNGEDVYNENSDTVGKSSEFKLIDPKDDQ